MHDANRAVQVRGTSHKFATRGGYLLAVGISGRRKNTRMLIETYRELVLGGHYRQPLVLVGGNGTFNESAGSSTMAIETAGAPMRHTDQGAGIFDVGKVTDYELSDLYRGADLLVSFSAEEGFGYPVLESLAHGTPALVTAGSPMQEIADGGIVATRLGQRERLNSLISAIGALPELRRETAKLDLAKYSVERLGSELIAALRGDDSIHEEV